MNAKLKRVLKWTGGTLLAAAVGIQLVPVDRSNPPVESDCDAPAEVKAILRRACYDCHSHETRWPWYGYVAPMSWVLADHIHEGRAELNFSRWGTYGDKKQEHKRGEIWEEVEAGKMPLDEYLWLHSEAVLSDADKAVLKAWATAGTTPGGDPHDENDPEHEDDD